MKSVIFRLNLVAVMLLGMIASSSAQAQCTPISSFPVKYSFETSEGFAEGTKATSIYFSTNYSDYEINMPCWENVTTQSGYTNQRFAIWSVPAKSVYLCDGAQVAFLRDQSSGNRNRLSLPPMQFTSQNGYSVAISVYRSSNTSPNSEGLRLYACTATDTTMLGFIGNRTADTCTTAYGIVPQETASGWYRYEFMLPQSMIGQVGTIMIMGESKYITHTYFDDIEIAEEPTCPRLNAQSLQLTAVTTNSATFTWAQAGSETAWDIVIRQGNKELVNTQVTGTPGYTLQGLAPSAGYSLTVSVNTNCSGEKGRKLTRNFVFQTQCGVVTDFPWSEDFEAYQQNELNFSSCWQTPSVLNSYTPNGFKVVSSYNFGSQALRAPDMTSGTKVMAVLPQMNIPSANDYEFIFQMYRAGATSKTEYLEEVIRVYVSPTPTIGNDAIELGAYGTYCNGGPLATQEKTYGIYQYSLTLPNAGLQYIILEKDCRFATSNDLDNFRVRRMPDCRPPKDMYLSATQKNRVQFRWNAANGEKNWLLRYHEEGTSDYSEARPTSTSFILNNLMSGTRYNYEFVMYSVCDGVLSEDSVIYHFKFETQCDVLTVGDELTYGFEEQDNVYQDYDEPCWKNENTTTPNATTPLWRPSYTAHQGSRSLTSSADGAVLMLPGMKIPTGYEFDLWAYRASVNYKDTIDVYVNTTQSLAGATKIGSTYTLSTLFTRYRFLVPSNGSTTQYIILVHRGSGTVYLDDLSLQDAPDCMPPFDLTLGMVTDNSAEFHWRQGGNESVWVALITDSRGSFDYEEELSETSYTLEGLRPETDYTITVTLFSYCDDGSSSEDEELTRTFQFTTRCEAENISQYREDAVIYQYGFERTDGESFSSGAILASQHPCWNLESNSSTNFTVYAYSASSYYSTNYAHGGSQALSLSQSSGRQASIMLPGVQVDSPVKPSDFELSFWANASSYGDSLVVLYNSIPTVEGATPIAILPLESSYKQYEILLPANGPIYIFLQGAGASGTIYVDDVLLRRLPYCRKVRDVHFEQVISSSALLRWQQGNEETDWHVKIMNGTAVLVDDTIRTTPEYLLDGLTEGTAYSLSVTVCALCDDQPARDFFEEDIMLVTPCLPLILSPTTSWQDGFEDYPSSSYLSEVSLCYAESGISNSSYSAYRKLEVQQPSSYYADRVHSGTQVLARSSSYVETVLCLPEVVIPEANEYEFRFWLYRHTLDAFDDSIRVYLSDTVGVNDRSQLLFSTRIYYNVGEWTEDEAGWHEYAITLPVAGQKRVVLVLDAAGAYMTTYLDDMKLRKIPACPGTGRIHVLADEATTSSVTLAWKNTGAAQYAVHYTVNEGAEQYQLVNDSLVVIGNLDAGTPYNIAVSVVPVCGADIAIDTAYAKLNAVTACGAIARLPWSENFENQPVGSTRSTGVLCWDMIPAVTTTYPYIYVNNSSSYARGERSLYFQSSATVPAFAVLPEFGISLSDAEIRYSYRYESTSVTGVLAFGYLTNVTDTSTFVTLQTDSLNNTQWHTLTVPLTSVPKGARLAFRYLSSRNYYYLGIDDIRIRRSPTCFPGTNLHVVEQAATENSVTFAWDANAASRDARIVVKNGKQVLADSILTDTEEFTLTGLQASRTYTFTVEVYTRCSASDEAPDALEATLTASTLCGTITELPVFYGFEVSEGFTLNGSYTYATTNTMPNCWENKITELSPNAYSMSADRIWSILSVSQPYEGEAVLALPDKGSTSAISKTMLVLPPVLIPTANEYEVILHVNRSASIGTNHPEGARIYLSNSDTIDYSAVEVGLASRYYNYNDPAFPAEERAGWYEYSFPISITGDVYLILQGESWYGNTSYFDNLTIRKIPTCHRPSDITAVAYPDSIVISWTGNAEDYLLTCPELNLVEEVVTGNSYTIRGLQPATRYNYTLTLQGYCGPNEMSDKRTTSISVQTECVPVTSFPVSYGFEAAEGFKVFSAWSDNSLAPCWNSETTLKSSGSQGQWYASSRQKLTGDGALSLPDQGNTTNPTHTLLSLPSMWIPEADAYEVVFHVYRPTAASATKHLEGATFYVSGSDTIDADAERIGFISRYYNAEDDYFESELSAGWYEYSFPISKSGLVYILMEGVSYYGDATYFDDFTIRPMPACRKPKNLQAEVLGAHDVRFSWDGLASSYKLTIEAVGLRKEEVVEGTTYLLEGLTSGMNYTFHVQLQALCDDNETSEVATKVIQLQTECAPIEDLAFSTGFEETSTYQMPLCWNRLTSYGNYPRVQTGAHGGEHALELYGGVRYNGPMLAILPEFDAESDLNDAEIRFYYKQNYTTAGYAPLVIGTMSDPTDSTTFVAQDTLPKVNTYSVYQYAFQNVPDDHHYIAIMLPSIASYMTTYYVDDIEVHKEATCDAPSNLQILDIQSDMVKISWEGGARYYYVAQGDEPAQRVSALSGGMGYFEVKGLRPNTKYEIPLSIEGQCSDRTRTFVYRDTLRFTSECRVIEVTREKPWTTGFEESEGFSTTLGIAACYSASVAAVNDYAGSVTNIWKVSNQRNHGAGSGQALRAQGAPENAITETTLHLPHLVMQRGHIYRFSFAYFHPNGTYPTDTLRLTMGETGIWSQQLAELDGSQLCQSSTGWQEYVVDTIPGQTGNSLTFSFVYKSDYGTDLYLDDLKMEDITPEVIDDPTRWEAIIKRHRAVKVLHNGRIYIRRDDVYYDAMGQKIDLE